jgi:hypothetical protein
VHKPPQSELPQQKPSTEPSAAGSGGTDDSPSEAPASASGALHNSAKRSAPRSINPRPATANSRNTIASVTDRHLPILLSTLRGELELNAVRHHDEQVAVIIAKALEQRRPVVYVVDARGVAMPSAMVRRYWATQINESRAVLDSMLGTFIILDNAIVRGALTAIVWMTDAAKRLSYVPTFEVALERANALLSEQGHARVDINISQRTLLP